MKVREVSSAVRSFLAGRAPVQTAHAAGWSLGGPGSDVSPGIRAILAEQPAAPTVQDRCALCGALENVRAGIYRTEDGRHLAGRRCIDHAGCELRRKQDARDLEAEADFLRPIR